MTIFLTVAIVLLLGLILYQFTQIDALWTELQNEKELRNAGVFGAHQIIAKMNELIGLMRGIEARITELEKTISNSAGLKEFKP